MFCFRKFANKLKGRIFSPPTRIEKSFWDLIFSILFLKVKKTKNQSKKKCLLIWDIRTNSITFDVVHLLFESNLRFSKIGINSFDVLIYFPKDFVPQLPSIENYSEYINTFDLFNRYKNLVIPIFESSNSVRKIFYSDNPKDTKDITSKYKNVLPKVFVPNLYSPIPQDMKFLYKNLLKMQNKRVLIPSFSKISLKGKKFSKKNKYLENRYLTFTVRDYGFNKYRNTNNNDIEKFIEFASLIKAKPIIVPDKISLIKKYEYLKDKCFIYKEAREDIYKRISLYKNSIVNIFSVSGPGQLSLLCGSSKSIFFNYGIGGIDGGLEYYKRDGLYKYHQPYLPMGGYIIWYEKNYSYTSKDLFYAYKEINNFNNQAKKLKNFRSF